MNDDSSLMIASRFAEVGVPCVIIGGYAVNFHGYPRSTQDIDLIFQRTPTSVSAMYPVLTELEAYWISDEIDATSGIEKTVPVTLDYIHRQHLMMLGTNLGYVDLFDFIPGLPSESLADLFASAEAVGSLRFVNLRWLRRLKEASGRPQDLIDLANLPEVAD